MASRRGVGVGVVPADDDDGRCSRLSLSAASAAAVDDVPAPGLGAAIGVTNDDVINATDIVVGNFAVVRQATCFVCFLVG